jgi:hypothetical protein
MEEALSRLEVRDDPDGWVPPVGEREREERERWSGLLVGRLGRARCWAGEVAIWVIGRKRKKGRRGEGRWAEGGCWAALG